jgi:glutamine amidotransferase
VTLVVTEPLTRDEDWVAFASGELQVFVEGQLLDTGAATAYRTPPE